MMRPFSIETQGEISYSLKLKKEVFITITITHLPAPGLAPKKPEAKIIDLRPAIVRKALLRVLNERKFSVDLKRTGLQSVETEWLQDGSFRSRVTTEIKPLDAFHTELGVKIHLERKAFWSKSWEPSDQMDPSAYSDFINAVQLKSYRVLYDGR